MKTTGVGLKRKHTIKGQEFCSSGTAMCGHSFSVAMQLMNNTTADVNNDRPCLHQVVGQTMSKHCLIFKHNGLLCLKGYMLILLPALFS